MKEEFREFYFVILNFPFRPLCGEHRLLCGTRKRSPLLPRNETIGDFMEVKGLMRKS
jgi:hypothetical protein